MIVYHINMWNWLANILFPEWCQYCEKLGNLVCHECVWRIPAARPATHPDILAGISYQHPLTKKLINLIKKHPRTDSTEILCERLADDIREEIIERILIEGIPDLILLPVPLTIHKQRDRGFNQSFLIAHILAEKLPISATVYDTVLIKTTETKKQALLKSRADRFINVQQSLQITDPTPIVNKHVCIIDDVTTTGATLLAARQIVLDAGAKMVLGIAIAH